MKPKIVAAVLFAAVVAFLAPRPAQAYVSVSISYFQNELSPYGRWVYSPAYGEVWYPTDVAATWQPYVDGEWAYTDYGWTWVSYDRFGSDPFHYGTWVWIDPYGWCWVPGYIWGPAWVTWAYTDFDIGWAPLPPTFVLSASGYFGSPVIDPPSAYVFVPTRSFVGTNVSRVHLASGGNAALLSGAHRATGFSISGGVVHDTGPAPSFVQRTAGIRLQRTTLAAHKLTAVPVTASGAGRGSRLAIVAPRQERQIASRNVSPQTRSAPGRQQTSAPAAPSRVAGTNRAVRAPSRAMSAQPGTMTSGRRASANAPPPRAASSVREQSRRPVSSGRSYAPATAPSRPSRQETRSQRPAPAPAAAPGRNTAPSSSARREESRMAMRPATPERSRPQSPPPAPAPRAPQQPRPQQAPQASQQPRSAPPPAARAPQPPRPQPAPQAPQKRGNGKEKQ